MVINSNSTTISQAQTARLIVSLTGYPAMGIGPLTPDLVDKHTPPTHFPNRIPYFQNPFR